MQLSPHFTLAQMTRSATAVAHGIDNTPSEAQTLNLEQLALTLLEPVRGLLGVPLFVNSGFRCPDLNRMVGGQPNSAHQDGRAADIVPDGLDVEAAWQELKSCTQMPFDQLILETNSHGATWLHLAIPPAGTPPRRMAFRLNAGATRAIS